MLDQKVQLNFKFTCYLLICVLSKIKLSDSNPVAVLYRCVYYDFTVRKINYTSTTTTTMQSGLNTTTTAAAAAAANTPY